MASAISHAVAALGIGATFYRHTLPRPVWLAGIVCAVLPDIDVIGFRFGIPYGDFWGIAASRTPSRSPLCSRAWCLLASAGYSLRFAVSLFLYICF